MRVRNAIGLLLAILLLPAAESGLARGPEPQRPPEAVGANGGPASDAPWVNIEVDTPHDTGQYASVAIDPSTGATYVSYYAATHGELRMAHYVGSGGNCGPGSSWSCQSVDSDGDVGRYSSIAAQDGEIAIAYHDATNGSLKYALASYGPTGSWWIQDVDRGSPPINTGLYPSLKFASNGSPYISYHSDNPTGLDALRIADFVGSGGNCGYGTTAGMWRCQTVHTGEGVGQHTSLAVVGDYAYRHIAYYDRGNGQLWYATNRFGDNCGPGGNTWTCYTVAGSTADVGQYTSLYVDGADHFHIAYYDATADSLNYAVDVGLGGNCGALFGSAQCDEIDAMMTGYHALGVSIAEDAAGYPIIAYQSAGGSLKVARPLAALGIPAGGGNCGPENLFYTWHCDTIDPHGQWVYYRNGDYASIAVSSSGLATVAYYGFITSSGGNLMVSQQRLHVFLPLVVRAL